MEGTFDQKYTLHVIYANGTTADVTIPMFRVTVTNPTSGAVVRTITAPVPPRAEPLLLDLSPPTGPTEVISPPQSLVDVDPRSPISIVFSRALDQVSVNANLIVFGRGPTGALTPVAGTWKLSQGNRVATFIPAGALRLNETYTIALSGVTDLAGAPVAGSSLTVTTFRPRKVGTAALLEPPTGQAMPLKDVSFVRQPGAPGGKVATRVIAATANQNGFKVHTIDVTDPRHPVEKGHTAGGSYKRRLAMLPNISAPSGVDVTYDVQLIPQETAMSCWAAGAAMLVGWRDRVSINPADIAARIGYGAQYEVAGLDGIGHRDVQRLGARAGAAANLLRRVVQADARGLRTALGVLGRSVRPHPRGHGDVRRRHPGRNVCLHQRPVADRDDVLHAPERGCPVRDDVSPTFRRSRNSWRANGSATWRSCSNSANRATPPCAKG